MPDKFNPIFDPSSSIFPVSTHSIFDNDSSTYLEIGFGEGEFIIDLSLKNPSYNYIGIEIKRGRFKKAARKAEKLCIQNLKLINIEAEIALKQIFSKNSFKEVFINFPDPWPKNKHTKHRLFNSSFTTLLSQTVTSGGKVHIKTDHFDYLARIINEFEVNPFFSNNLKNKDYKKDINSGFETKFEKEFKEKGKEIFLTTFTNLSF